MTETDGTLRPLSWTEIDGEEAERLAGVLDLIALQEPVQRLKAWAMEALGPAAGESALDVGCGTGEDVVAFADRVGPDGRAVGVEPNAGLRSEAARRVGAGPSSPADAPRRTDVAELVDGDAYALPFEDASFDAIRCERVLQHLEDPERATVEMARVLKPGGRIALIDTDWQTAIVHPVDPEVMERMVAGFRHRTANPYSGRQLRGLLASAGLSVCGETAATWIEPQSGATDGFVPMMAASAQAAGVITEQEAERFNAGLAEAAERDAFHLSLTMYAVTATKP